MKQYDLLGVGLGPSNMSLAALLTKTKLEAVFIEKQKKIAWHPGMLIPDSKLQVPCLDDLVTPVDPTNPFSFTNFLVNQKRFYAFLAKDTVFVTRKEYEQYLNWVLEKLPFVQSEEEVLDVEYDQRIKLFTVKTTKDTYQAKHLAVGTGHTPRIPKDWQHFLSDYFYHSSQVMQKKTDFSNKKVAIIGGGQSGTEIFSYILSKESQPPKKITWFSRRTNFLPLDDIAFTNELFTPDYVEHFHSLETSKKLTLLQDQKTAIDGVSSDTLLSLYEKLYELRYVQGMSDLFSLLPGHEVKAIEKNKHGAFQLAAKSMFSSETINLEADIVILCTGYESSEFKFFKGLEAAFHKENDSFIIHKDYSLSWEGEGSNSIYILNGARHTHGISDATFSISAWRSATIVNQLSKKAVYPDINYGGLITWR